jgi:2-haloacid dehalogenase
MFDAAIFDLGGVFIDWNPRHLYRKLFPGDEEAMERFLSEVTTSEWNHELDAGRPFAEAIADLQVAHPEHAELIAAYWDRWPEMIGEVNQDTAQIVRDLRGRGLHVYALSNWSAETYPRTIPLAPELHLFEDVLLSGEAKLAKPDPRVFAIATQRFKVEPARTVFIDDMAANVAAARAAGFPAIQFTDAAALRAALLGLGLLTDLLSTH